MKQKILYTLALLMMTVAVLPTALHAQAGSIPMTSKAPQSIVGHGITTLDTKQPDTITVKTDLFDNLLWQVAKGQATQRTLDTLKLYYKEAVERYDSSQNNVIALLKEREAASKYIATLQATVSALNGRVSASEVKYQTLYNKRNKAFGIGVSAGYNPFTRLPAMSIGLHYNLIRFSLRGLFADGQGVETQDPNIRVIR